jgi:hypothetical protein
MTENYTLEKKKKLADRIQKLTEKSDLIRIKNLIAENNPDISFTKNSNGYFLYFHNLSNETYLAINKFLDKVEKRKLMIINSEINTELADESETINEDYSDRNISKKLRLTNTENHLLNRVKYEKELKKNETNVDEHLENYNINGNSNDIFISNTNKKKLKGQ